MIENGYPEKDVLLITGLLRNFDACLDYLIDKDAFKHYRVRLSTWDSQIEQNTASLELFETFGGEIVSNPEPYFSKLTSAVAQHFSLRNGLRGLKDGQIVLKTRTDWIVTHDILSIVNRKHVDLARCGKIIVHGYSPGIPYFINDGTFMALQQTLEELSNLDLSTFLTNTNLHVEQYFFLPDFPKRSDAFEFWLSNSLGTQYDPKLAEEWVKVRLRSRLWYHVTGEFFARLITDFAFFEDCQCSYDKRNGVPIAEAFFSDILGPYDSLNSVLVSSHDPLLLAVNLEFSSPNYKEAFFSGLFGKQESPETLNNWNNELTDLIVNHSILAGAYSQHLIDQNFQNIPPSLLIERLKSEILSLRGILEKIRH
jgi:hypothetical protein